MEAQVKNDGCVINNLFVDFTGWFSVLSRGNGRYMDELNKKKMWDAQHLALLDSVITFMKCYGTECKDCKLNRRTKNGILLCDEIARLVWLIGENDEKA